MRNGRDRTRPRRRCMADLEMQDLRLALLIQRHILCLPRHDFKAARLSRMLFGLTELAYAAGSLPWPISLPVVATLHPHSTSGLHTCLGFTLTQSSAGQVGIKWIVSLEPGRG